VVVDGASLWSVSAHRSGWGVVVEQGGRRLRHSSVGGAFVRGGSLLSRGAAVSVRDHHPWVGGSLSSVGDRSHQRWGSLQPVGARRPCTLVVHGWGTVLFRGRSSFVVGGFLVRGWRIVVRRSCCLSVGESDELGWGGLTY
jgi:hypothetical protein